MKLSKLLLLVLIAVCLTNARGATNTRQPHLGYAYPAGGRQGSVVEITAGGQYLQGASSAYVTGEGVHASVIQYVRPLTKQQLQALRKKISQLQRQKMAEAAGRGRRFMRLDRQKDPNNPPLPKEEIPEDHPLLQNLEDKSIEELQYLMKEFLNPKKQQNMQIAETVLIRVTIDPNAEAGDRELRIGTATGLTNPLCFQVGTLPEVNEVKFKIPSKSSVALIMPPFVFNGQVMPGEADRLRFRAHAGQHLVMEVQARRLIPYLADAVPGWFQAMLTLRDANSRELACADDYRFNPDPVLYYEIPKGGIYELEIRDAIYRGREDFVYRITVSEQPFISQMFPLGGQMGVPKIASIAGWNLPKRKLAIDTNGGLDGIREAALRQNRWLSNSIPYAVSTLPECNEIETNDAIKDAQQIALPRIINGRIARAGDVDVFRFDGHAGDKVVAEVYARRLNSSLDSLLRLTDASGKLVAMNDDYDDKETGLLTHQADSYLAATLPKDGTYYVHLSDSQHHGGMEYGYRLRVGPPQPDFALRLTPSSISVSAGNTAAISLHVLRKDGFDGDIDIVLRNAPKGFVLGGAHIPAGRDRVNMTLTAPRAQFDEPVILQLDGRAKIAGAEIVRPVVPAEDMMQAFAYRHLVPSQELMVAVIGGKRWMPSFSLSENGIVQIPAGGIAKVPIEVWKRPMLQNLKLELADPPKGISLKDVMVDSDKMILVLKADANSVAGYRDNLLVEASTEMSGNQKDKNKKAQKQRVFLGAVPAIPIEIVQQ